MLANLIISIRPVQDGVTANAVAREAKDTQQQEYPDYEVLEETEDANAPVPHFRRLYRWHNVEKESHILQCQAYYVYQNRLYTLTATQPSHNAEIGKLDKTLIKMMNSFNLELGD